MVVMFVMVMAVRAKAMMMVVVMMARRRWRCETLRLGQRRKHVLCGRDAGDDGGDGMLVMKSGGGDCDLRSNHQRLGQRRKRICELSRLGFRRSSPESIISRRHRVGTKSLCRRHTARRQTACYYAYTTTGMHLLGDHESSESEPSSELPSSSLASDSSSLSSSRKFGFHLPDGLYYMFLLLHASRNPQPSREGFCQTCLPVMCRIST